MWSWLVPGHRARLRAEAAERAADVAEDRRVMAQDRAEAAEAELAHRLGDIEEMRVLRGLVKSIPEQLERARREGASDTADVLLYELEVLRNDLAALNHDPARLGEARGTQATAPMGETLVVLYGLCLAEAAGDADAAGVRERIQARLAQAIDRAVAALEPDGGGS